MEVTVRIPTAITLLRSWRWTLLAALVLVLTLTGGSGPARAAFPGANGKIAFHSDRDGNYEVYAMNADGSGQTRLTNNAATDVYPAWSPGGTKIAFTSNRDGNSEVYSMNADGSGQTNVSNNAADDAVPAWSPDGTKIAFKSNRDGTPEIYVMNADGSGQTRLTNNAADDADPDWQPLPLPLNITSLGQYALPKTCFEVRNSSEVALFTVCDNDYAGPPAANVLCIPDGICNDENPLQGGISLNLTAGAYRVVESVVAPQHIGEVTSKACDATSGSCNAAFLNTPKTRPWFPWDLVGTSGPTGPLDGKVTIVDVLNVISKFGQQKPLP